MIFELFHYQIRKNRHQISGIASFSAHFDPFSDFFYFFEVFHAKTRVFLILADICDFGQKCFSLKMNYLSFQWLLRGVFSKRELKSASNEHHFDPYRPDF